MELACQNGGHFNKLQEITCIGTNVDLPWDIGSLKDLQRFSGRENLNKIDEIFHVFYHTKNRLQFRVEDLVEARLNIGAQF